MGSQSPDQAARVHESRLRVAQSAFEEGHCTICFEEYAGRHALTPCCQRKLCCECAQKAHEGTILPDFLSSGSGGRVIATGSKCPYCRAAWNAPPACVEQQESSGPVSQDQGEENISMHGEGGHYTQLLGSGSTFVDRDCEVASTVALSEAQDGAGNQLFHQDGSLIALDGADVAQSASGELHANGAASSHEHVGEPGNQLVHQDGMLIAPDGADFAQSVSGELALEAQRKLSNSGELHGKKRGPNSWDMATRIWYGHFDHNIPTQPTSEVLTTGLLFKILLQEIETAGLHDRIDRNARGEVVRAARDGNKLHGRQGKPFMQSCQPPWTEMSSPQRLLALRCFMRHKFSIDTHRRVMIPWPVEHWERAEISWGQHFFLTEAELEAISQEVIDNYERCAHEIECV